MNTQLNEYLVRATVASRLEEARERRQLAEYRSSTRRGRRLRRRSEAL